MGKKSLFRSTSKKKKKTGLGVPKPKSTAKSEKKITAKAVNKAIRPTTDLSAKATDGKSEDQLTTTKTSANVKSSTEKADTGVPAQTKRLPETVETDNYKLQASQKGENQPIEAGVSEPDANNNGTEKIFNDVKKNATTTDTSKVAASTYLTNTVITNKNNDPPKLFSDKPESPKVVINYESEVEMETSTAAKKGIIISVATLLLIYALIISASVRNTRNYYVKTTLTAVEVRQGCFAPLGVEKEPFITIQDVRPPSLVKDVYTRAEIFHFISDHYLKAADAVIEQPGIPDVKKVDTLLKLAREYADNDLIIFNFILKAADAVINQPGILDVKKVDTLLKLAREYADNDLIIFNFILKAADAVINQSGIPDVKKVDTFLKLAREYADNDLNRKAANSRINGLKQLFLIYKADIAIFKGTAPDLQTAAEYLEKAMLLAIDKNQKERIQRQLESVQRLTAELEQPHGSVTENEKTPVDEAEPTDQSSEKNEKAEKNLAPLKSDKVEEKKATTDSTAIKEEKHVVQDSKNDKQAVDAKTDTATEK
ncbi:hypothetical protein QUF90_09755 [Desulfococcaceae bacterium HSG9]|nr:hypothetical protein [Desulfococcaceae bacterium HSG9]